MKKILLLLAMAVATYSYAGPRSIQQKLAEDFPNASNVQWYNDDNGYTAYFSTPQARVRVYYDKDQKFLYALKYYTAKELPLNIVRNATQKYSGYTIKTVTEMTTDESTKYELLLENETTFKKVMFYADGSTEVLQKMTKQAQ
ncbi:MAG: hypothetical protein J0I41_04310 [Filimonas sp.]|nr:hypothetical protein [Filimonas sp.]